MTEGVAFSPFMAAPLRILGGTDSPLNPIAVF
jgi:hypothetical protein